MLLFLVACASTPPVQEMAEARSAISAARQISDSSPPAEAALQSAEQALEEASRALEAEHYERARQKALEAKRKAQEAARLKYVPVDQDSN